MTEITRNTDIVVQSAQCRSVARVPQVPLAALNPLFGPPNPSRDFGRAFCRAAIEAPAVFLALTVLVALSLALLSQSANLGFGLFLIAIIAQILAFPVYLLIGLRLARIALRRSGRHPAMVHMRLLVAGWITSFPAAALYALVALVITRDEAVAFALAAFCLRCGFIYSTLFAPVFAWRFLRAVRKQIPTSEKET